MKLPRAVSLLTLDYWLLVLPAGFLLQPLPKSVLGIGGVGISVRIPVRSALPVLRANLFAPAMAIVDSRYWAWSER